MPLHSIVTQGIEGSFHYEAVRSYFKDEEICFLSATTFNELADVLSNNEDVRYGVMAIENSIAGSIIKNYRIIREQNFRIIGEKYLPIVHNLLVVPGQKIGDIKEVYSHPMALNQCLTYLNHHGIKNLISTKDTAGSAKMLSERKLKSAAAIGSKASAEIYGLEILDAGIQTSKINYTRFFILQKEEAEVPIGDFNKASIYLRTAHKKGSLLKVLEKIYANDINLSKLQSFPIMDTINKYYFHLDLEFENRKKYEALIPDLEKVTQYLQVLGVYKNGIKELENFV